MNQANFINRVVKNRTKTILYTDFVDVVKDNFGIKLFFKYKGRVVDKYAEPVSYVGMSKKAAKELMNKLKKEL